MLFSTTPITCDSASFSVIATGVRSSGPSSGIPVCTSDSTSQSVNLTYSFPSSLSFTSTSSVSLQVASTNGSPLFSHGVSYELHLDTIDRTVVVKETLTNDATTQVTGDVTVDLSAIPTEYLYSGVTSSRGYSCTRAELAITFNLPASDNNYQQINAVFPIPNLQLVTGLVALASGVIAGGVIGGEFRHVFLLSMEETPCWRKIDGQAT